MPAAFKKVAGSICAPRGFRAASVFCDIKRLGTGKGSEKGRKRDLALIVSEVPAVVAGMFTANQVCAAPVKVSAKHCADGSARAIVVNSGNANACTGARGMRDAQKMARLTAEIVAAVYDRRNGNETAVIDRRYRTLRPNEVLVASTGRIGVTMPMANVERGIRMCAPLLTRSASAARDVAEAIMTSDTRRKEVAVECKVGSTTIRIGGICKGAGMIQPGMIEAKALHATMLGFIMTDAAVERSFLRKALAAAVRTSFNRITVDGDMSTNDSVIALANGLAGNRRLSVSSPASRRKIFQQALDYVCLQLAKMIVLDGEGVSRFVTVKVSGARNDSDGEAVARAIANSALVKTSWHGGDPNWGRIICATGYSAAKVDESRMDIGYSRPGHSKILYGFRNGGPTKTSLLQLAAITARPEFDVHVNLRVGHGQFVMYASDLTEDYVSFNKGDVSDPTSLGG